MESERRGVRISAEDDVAVALESCAAGDLLRAGEVSVTVREDIPAGHKVALRTISEGEPIRKYGFPIGIATSGIPQGAWVHVHNLRTGLDGVLEYRYRPDFRPLSRMAPPRFPGFLRKDGKAGVRNEIWILPTVGCVNSVARNLERLASPLAAGRVDGVFAFCHPHGCSQVGEDLFRTQKILAGLARHPNAGGILILGLGCECNHIAAFQKVLEEWDPERVKFLNCQDVPDETAEGLALLRTLIETAAGDVRVPVSADRLIVGLKCGGSDGFSGITANPVVGNFSDRLCAMGGTAILTEVPEMFGAETILMDRCETPGTFEKTVKMINDFKLYFSRYGQPIYENPSPGNKAGGLTTLEDKSLGCTQKGGTAPVRDVAEYGEAVKTQGLNLLAAPGNDLVAATACAAAGAQIVLFTTGRGTPFGCPVPTVKIATNPDLAARKPGWIDFDASPVLTGTPVPDLGASLFEEVLSVAGGSLTRNERNGCRDLAVFKDGITE